MLGKTPFTFSATIWKHGLQGSWHFATMPVIMANEIRANLGMLEEGWGRLQCTAKIENTVWSTAIWFDSKHQSYLLPIKANVRKKLGITCDDLVNITVWI